jgi:uncharacterized protein
MTLNSASSLPTAADAVHSTLRSPVWRSFTFETGHFLLHVPTSHVLEVPEILALQVRGLANDAEAEARLAELERELPQPPPRKPVVADIRAISLNMAQGCNLRCTYCFAGEGDYGVKGMMTPELAIDAVRTLSAGKDRFHVVFFGGEPMLNYAAIKATVDWCEAEAAAGRTRYTYAMTTNATLLNEEKLAWLKERRFALTISYDGQGLHAKQRLNKDKISNSQALVERKLANFHDQLAAMRGMTLRTTVTKGNLDLVEEAIVATLTSQNFRLAVSHHATALQRLAFTLADIERLGAIYRSVIDRLLAAGDHERLLKLDNVTKYVQTIKHGRTGQIACGAGVSYLTVSVEGDFYLCHRFNEDAEESYGSVAKGLDHAKLAEIGRFRGAGADPCKTCWMREWCAGGCFHESKAATGDKFGIDPLYCKLQDLEIEQALRVYTILRERAPHLLER